MQEEGKVELLNGVRRQTNAWLTLLSFVFFWTSFVVSWFVSSKTSKQFRLFSPCLKADWSSRVNSSLHSVLVITGVFTALFRTDWTEDFMAESSTRFADAVFSLAIGYFLCDLLVILLWKVPMWPMYITHHLVAVIPYLINNFLSHCYACHYELLLFLLVEIATLPLNLRGFVELLGKHDGRTHVAAIYLTYVFWALTRTVLPIYLIYAFWAYAYPSQYANGTCLYPNLICGHIIAAFCIGVFFGVHTPELLTRWGWRTDSTAAASISEKNSQAHEERQEENQHEMIDDQEENSSSYGTVPLATSTELEKSRFMRLDSV